MSSKEVVNAITSSNIAKDLTSNLLEIIIDFLEVQNIFFCSHKGSELVAYNIHGDYLGTICKTVEDDAQENDQWLTGFDFDSSGALYVALYSGFMAKYPIPSNQTIYSTQLSPRPKDTTFQHNIDNIIHTHNIIDDTAPEGIVVLETDKYKSVFITCMEPINGIMQFSFDGKLQRIICANMLNAPWSVATVPSYFVKSAVSKFLQNKNMFMVQDGACIQIIDVDTGTVKSGLVIAYIATGSIGDFEFIEPRYVQKNDVALLMVNLQNGVFQFHQLEMFWMLKRINLNENIKRFEELKGKKIKQCYGTSVGPNGCVYICDHDNNRILRIHIVDYDMILNQVNHDVDWNKIDVKVFAEMLSRPNYCRWYDASNIGLDFVKFPQDEGPSEILNESDNED
eukprot:219804_1